MKVYADWYGREFEARATDGFWNGFAVPLFTRGQAEEYLRVCNDFVAKGIVLGDEWPDGETPPMGYFDQDGVLHLPNYDYPSYPDELGCNPLVTFAPMAYRFLGSQLLWRDNGEAGQEIEGTSVEMLYRIDDGWTWYLAER